LCIHIFIETSSVTAERNTRYFNESRNCDIKHIIVGKMEGGIEVMGRKGRRRKQLLNDLKEMTEYRKLEERALYRPL
jgi:hypothetical protein